LEAVLGEMTYPTPVICALVWVTSGLLLGWLVVEQFQLQSLGYGLGIPGDGQLERGKVPIYEAWRIA